MKKVLSQPVFQGIVAGTVLSFVLSLLFVDILPFYLSGYLPIFCGGLAGGYLGKEKPAMIGLVVSINLIFLLIGSLALVFYSTSKTFEASYLNSPIIVGCLLLIPCSIAGAYLGLRIRNKITTHRLN